MRYMNRIILIGILLLLTSVDAAAQSTITGTVIDSLSFAPLPKASVMLLRGGRTILFARADNNGHFSIEAQAQPGDELQATCMGYKKHRQPVGKDNVIRLVQQAFQLKEVMVQGPPVTQRRDTIVYDLTKFANERDNNLKDVLKKLPGVDIEKNGQIKYKGKAINRFTVEGLDLSKGQYNKLTDNIRAKDVKKAEVVDADALIIRTRTRCDARLLEGTPVKIIATATIGMDHIDFDYCNAHKIEVHNAQGCNAGGVAQYVFSALFGVAARKAMLPLRSSSFVRS